jgi:hypothetical protein
MLRILDVEAGLAIAAVWAATAHFAAGADQMFAITFFLAAFFLFTASALTGRRGAALITGFAMGLLSMHTASVAGPGAYKLALFTGAGLAFEIFHSIRKDGWPSLGALGAALSMPISMWLLSGATTSLWAVADMMLIAVLAGGAGTAAALVLWWRLAHTKAVIRFQCTDSVRSALELKNILKAEKQSKRFLIRKHH